MTLKNIILLGATGSIGASTLNLIRQKRDMFNIIGISTFKKTEQLKMISEEFNVKNVCYFENNKDVKFSKYTNVLKELVDVGVPESDLDLI